MAAHPDPAELWFVDLEACADGLDEVERRNERLSSQDLKKITASPGNAAKQRRASYIALRILIERYWGEGLRQKPFVLTGSGKPVLPGLPGSFSLAHVDRYALIGLTSNGTIGVDLEPDREPIVSGERRARIEAAAIALGADAPLPSQRQLRFLQAWVRLEAVAKADGRGIGRLLTGLGIIGVEQEPGFAFDYANDVKARFHVRDVKLGGGCVGAVAMDGEVLPASAAINGSGAGDLLPASTFPPDATQIEVVAKPPSDRRNEDP